MRSQGRWEIVGVVGPVKQSNLETPARPECICRFDRLTRMASHFYATHLLRCKMNPEVGGVAYNVSQLRRRDAEMIDPNVAVSNVRQWPKCWPQHWLRADSVCCSLDRSRRLRFSSRQRDCMRFISYGIKQTNARDRRSSRARRNPWPHFGNDLQGRRLLLGAGVAAGLRSALLAGEFRRESNVRHQRHDPFSFAIVSLLWR